MVPLSSLLETGRASVVGGGRLWLVLWCLCNAVAPLVLVEQPDTIAGDYLPIEAMPGVEVVRTRAAHFGDAADKYLANKRKKCGCSRGAPNCPGLYSSLYSR